MSITDDTTDEEVVKEILCRWKASMWTRLFMWVFLLKWQALAFIDVALVSNTHKRTLKYEDAD